jgi:cytochrome c5
MNNEKHCLRTRREALRARVLITAIIAGVSACAVLLGVLFYVTEADSLEMKVEKKAVTLKQSHKDDESLFTAKCGQCHTAPDPAKTDPVKNDCTKGFSKDELASVKRYRADVRTGKSLYESQCVRCHALIDPGSRTIDYWSKNICTSDECFVRKLHEDEEQQLLLYLSSHAKKIDKGGVK